MDSFETGELARQGLEVFHSVSAVALGVDASREFIVNVRAQMCE